MLSIKGTVKQILTAESGISKAGKEWNKQEFIIESDEQFPKPIAFTLFGDKLKLIDNIKIGQSVEVFFNLESREYNEKWFHNINAWKIDVEQSQPAQEASPVEFKADDIPPEQNDDNDGLPF